MPSISSDKMAYALEEFKRIVGDQACIFEKDSLEKYSHDQTERLTFFPEIVLLPSTTAQVSAIMQYCYREEIIVTPRGAGTGLVGGALPVQGGVVISFEKMNRILDIDEDNLQVTVEPGVITEVLQETLKKKGLFYPPDPSSRGSCFIGGNIASNSGGPKAVKYGVVKDYVLNLEVVLPNGEIIQTGANVLKNVTGYNLTQLIVGSEGTLGLVTKIVLKLLPHPQFDLLMLVPFNNLENAGKAVSAIFRAGFIPSAMELVEVNALRIVSDYLGGSPVPLTEETQAHLLIETDGNDLEVLSRDMEGIAAVLEQFDCGEIFFADDAAQKERLWKLRRRVAEAVKVAGYTLEEDTVVPRAQLPQLITGVKSLGVKYGFEVVCYGHAGDGNLHVRIRFPGNENSLGNEHVRVVLNDLFTLVHSLGGTISAEHGIGLIQKGFLSLVMNDAAIQLQREIKRVFDPKNLLNPGKIFDLNKK